MTKREHEAITRKITRIETAVGKKRDEIRGLVSEMEALLDSVNGAAEEMDTTVAYLRDARDSLDAAADKASEYV